MRKVNSFTIIELTTALLISGLVLGISYYSFLFFKQQFNKYRSSVSEKADYFLFRKALSEDISGTKMITDSSSRCLIFENSQGHFTYCFDTSGVIRVSGSDITGFHIKPYDIQFHKIDDTTNLVDNISLEIKVGRKKLSAVFQKQYSSEETLKYIEIIHERGDQH